MTAELLDFAPGVPDHMTKQQLKLFRQQAHERACGDCERYGLSLIHRRRGDVYCPLLVCGKCSWSEALPERSPPTDTAATVAPASSYVFLPEPEATSSAPIGEADGQPDEIRRVAHPEATKRRPATKRRKVSSRRAAGALLLLSADQVAQRLSVSVRTVWRMIERKELVEPIRFNRKLVLWRADELESWMRGLAA